MCERLTHSRYVPHQILINFCAVVGIHDAITYANFGDCRLMCLVYWVQILRFSIDSLAYLRACDITRLTICIATCVCFKLTAQFSHVLLTTE